MFISTNGWALDSELDRMNVEALWRSGQYVFWQTGITMPSPPPASEGYEKDTHCSAFAAAVALRLGVPLLSPPPEKLLANRQAEWLATLPSGWQRAAGPVEAQDLANQGYCVVISYENPNPSESGHIQIVRAHDLRSTTELESVGPQIIQAGKVNFNSTTAAEGFSSGYAPSYPSYPWPKNVKYYAHTTAVIGLEAEPIVGVE
jgi:hypothetical protein